MTKGIPITKESALSLVPGDVIIDDRGIKWAVREAATSYQGIRGSFGKVTLKPDETENTLTEEYIMSIGKVPDETEETVLFMESEEWAIDVDLSSPEARIVKAAA